MERVMKVIQYTLNIMSGISLYLEINQLARTVTHLRCNDLEGKAFKLHCISHAQLTCSHVGRLTQILQPIGRTWFSRHSGCPT